MKWFLDSIFKKLQMILLLSILITGNISCTKKAPLAKVQIIPRPLHMELKEGTFDIGPKTRWIVSSPNAAMLQGIEIVLEEIRNASTFPIELERIKTVKNGDNTLVFNINGNMDNFGEEGYTLSITPDHIYLSSTTPAGVFYGLQTLRQLFPPQLEDSTYKSGRWVLPCVEITDKPCFVWRGDMLDVSRHFLPLAFIKKNLDYLARYKMNTFHWHLTDDQGWRIESKKFPSLTRIGAWRVDHNDEEWWGRDPQKPGENATYGGFYTQKEIRDVVKYAENRFITIVPEIDMPGHSRAAIASIPEISCDGGPYTVATGGIASNNTLCPGKEKTFEFIDSLLSEILPLFPGKYFHVGGDECNKSSWVNCPDCQARIKKEGLKDEHELQSYFIRRVEKIVNRHGKQLIGWDEILEGGLAPNAAVMSWRGEQGGIDAARMGHDVVMTPTTYCYLDLKQGDPDLEPPLGYNQASLSTVYSYDPVPDVLNPDKQKHILGTQGNLWGESIQNEENANYMLFPRLLAIAEVGWTPKYNRKWDDFVRRLEYNLTRLDNLGIGYAPSMYNVKITPVAANSRGSVNIRLTTESNMVPIYYTLDGSDPDTSSYLYKDIIKIEGTTSIKAASYRNNRIERISIRREKLHKAVGIVPVLEFPGTGHTGKGNARNLTDCIRGTNRRNLNGWTDFEGIDMNATIDFGKSEDISNITVGCLERQNFNVFYPRKIEVLGSSDGHDYTLLGSVDNLVQQNRRTGKRDFEIDFKELQVRYIRVKAINIRVCPEWSNHPGEKAILLVDEISVD